MTGIILSPVVIYTQDHMIIHSSSARLFLCMQNDGINKAGHKRAQHTHRPASLQANIWQSNDLTALTAQAVSFR
ncbi:MAG: hypothetical protein ACPGSM_10090 [Thiolinea sp.]